MACLLLLAGATHELRIVVEAAELGIRKLGVNTGEVLLVVVPVTLHVAQGLVIRGDLTNLVEIRFEGEDDEAERDDNGQTDEPDGLHVATVVTEVEREQEDNAEPATDLDDTIADTVPAPLG